MNKNQSMSLRARINNFAKINKVSPQLALQRYFTERFLERISKSAYAAHLAIKGGTLMGEILGVAQRTTMDIDVTVVGIAADEDVIAKVVREIAAIDVGDGIVFTVDPGRPGVIEKDDDYGGYSIGMIAMLGTIKLPLGIDITYGDVITPAAELRNVIGLIDGSVRIPVLAYTVETLIAEKLQAVLKRGVASTRPRDLYDLHMLAERHCFDGKVLKAAIARTFANRSSEELLVRRSEILLSVEESEFQQSQWQRFQRKMSYAKGVEFARAITSIRKILGVSLAEK